MFIRGYEALPKILASDAFALPHQSRDLFSSSSHLLSAANDHETFRLRNGDDSSLPNVISPNSGDTEDFFATVATYYPQHSPLSAMVHILSKETVNLFIAHSEGIPRRKNNRNTKQFRMACLGAAIGEAMLAGLSSKYNDMPSYATCRRTLAFSLCRGSLLYDSALDADTLAKRWVRLRKISRLSISSNTTNAVLLAHELSLKDNIIPSRQKIDFELTKALQNLATGKDNYDLLASTLTYLYPATRHYLYDFKGAFDGRMLAFNQIVEIIKNNSCGIQTDEIAIAFFCNQILPGSFIHAGVLAGIVELFPAALVWYGFMSALTSSSTPQKIDPGLISKLDRDLLESFSFEERPRCDISLDELQVLSTPTLNLNTIRPTQQKALLVALLPGLDIYTRLVNDNDFIENTRRDTEINDLHNRVSRMLEEAIYTLKSSETPKKTPPPKGTSRKFRKDW
ncbi:hypothetical protein F2A38_10645 [Pseudomonas chlororaphis]|uniref:Uncharacterized protein n=1 Tax=Pseudomonas chlororaphis TaxID=587753 RepID=A0AB34C6S8_9PSED|nr:hypothetical protein [Pseudomonas chlororaphis]KAA5842657.1 hypothetical protein F2A38_10645 [Pseudomonas chlororaphis]